MPSFLHEALVQLFRDRPALIASLLSGEAQARVPPVEPVVLEADMSQVTPIEYRADLVLGFGDELRLVLEVQLRRDPGKAWSWPLYLAALRAKARCPVVLLVVTTSADVARWAAQPIDMGHPDFRLRPLVIGPEAVPVVTDFDAARQAPELAVLSALAHAQDERAGHIALAVMVAAERLDRERAVLYGDLVLRSLGQAARKALEALMASGRYEVKSEFGRKFFEQGAAEGRSQGRVEGRLEGRVEAQAEAVLGVLARRGIELTAEQRDRITGCTDSPTLVRWFDRAFEVSSADDLFA